MMMKEDGTLALSLTVGLVNRSRQSQHLLMCSSPDLVVQNIGFDQDFKPRVSARGVLSDLQSGRGHVPSPDEVDSVPVEGLPSSLIEVAVVVADNDSLGATQGLQRLAKDVGEGVIVFLIGIFEDDGECLQTEAGVVEDLAVPGLVD